MPAQEPLWICENTSTYARTRRHAYKSVKERQDLRWVPTAVETNEKRGQLDDLGRAIEPVGFMVSGEGCLDCVAIF